MYYELHGRRDPDAPTILLSSGLGGSAAYWTPQLAALGAQFRIVAYDQRGTGRTGGALPDDYTIRSMAADVIELLSELKIERCHFMGHALGGLVGLQLALDRPDLLDRLVVVNAWASADPHTGRCFSVRTELLQKAGIEAYVRAQPIFLYPAAWLSAEAERIGHEEAAAIAHFPSIPTVLKRIGALLAFDISERLAEIVSKTLVVATRDDILVPFTCSVRLAADLPDGQLALFEEGGHAVNVTASARFDARVLSFPDRRGRMIAEDFRDAMARLGAAVNVITTDGPGGRAGFTASAVCSVTDAPPTLLVCLNRGSSAYRAVTTNGVLCVNVLASDHEPLSRVFGGKTSMEERFAAAAWSALETGSPVLAGAVAAFDCRIAQVLTVGTHDVLFCETVAIARNDELPGLAYFARRYHTLDAS